MLAKLIQISMLSTAPQGQFDTSGTVLDISRTLLRHIRNKHLELSGTLPRHIGNAALERLVRLNQNFFQPPCLNLLSLLFNLLTQSRSFRFLPQLQLPHSAAFCDINQYCYELGLKAIQPPRTPRVPGPAGAVLSADAGGRGRPRERRSSLPPPRA